MLNLGLIGLNHRTADIDLRERAAFRASELPAVLRQIAELPSVREAAIFSTCNRVELLARIEDPVEGLQSLESFFCRNGGFDQKDLRNRLYRFTEDQVVRHVFRVASSLDSMILGEPQILGQLKSFYNTALEAGTVGSYLNTLLQAAIHTAKRVRSETSIGEYSVSVSSAAVDLARKIFGSLHGKKILIVGAGKMGQLAVRHLVQSGADCIRVANRSDAAAAELAVSVGGEAVGFDQLPRWMALSDVVITSTGAQEKLVDRTRALAIMAERKNAPLVFLDISVPRNVDPAVGTLDNVFAYDLDDLGAVVQANLGERRREAAQAERIVDQEVDLLCAKLRSLEMSPVLVELQGRIEEICRSELERYLRKARPQSERERQELDKMVSRIAGKIAHPVISQMKNLPHDAHDGELYLEAIRRIFKLQKSTEG